MVSYLGPDGRRRTFTPHLGNVVLCRGKDTGLIGASCEVEWSWLASIAVATVLSIPPAGTWARLARWSADRHLCA